MNRIYSCESFVVLMCRGNLNSIPNLSDATTIFDYFYTLIFANRIK